MTFYKHNTNKKRGGPILSLTHFTDPLLLNHVHSFLVELYPSLNKSKWQKWKNDASKHNLQWTKADVFFNNINSLEPLMILGTPHCPLKQLFPLCYAKQLQFAWTFKTPMPNILVRETIGFGLLLPMDAMMDFRIKMGPFIFSTNHKQVWKGPIPNLDSI